MKKIISLIMVALMVMSILPMTVFAEELNQPKLSIDSTQATPGEVFDVNVVLSNNPGIVSANLKVAFDEGLTLVGATNGSVFSTLTYIPPKQLESTGRITSSCQFAWTGFDIADEDIKNGTILTLSFEITEEAEIGDTFNIAISNNAGDVIDKNLNKISFSAECTVTAVDYTPCDVNDDGSINMLDVVLLSRYIVDGCKYDPNGYAVSISEKAADMNGDGSVNMLDVVLTSRYIVDGCKYVAPPDGYGVKPVSSGISCNHELQAIELKEATCTEEGHIEYWQCTKCSKYFADENATSQITAEDIVIAATGHTTVIDAAVAPTYESTGLTEGSHCSVCSIILQAQEVIPMLEKTEYSITYDLYNGDSYLQTIGVENSNPSCYDTNTGLQLKNIKATGYKFLGWYDLPAGSNAEIVKSIPAGTTGEIELYAHWEKEVYEVEFEFPTQFDADLVSLDKVTYTVDKGVVLPTPQLEGYIFAGWSDDEGNIIKKVPVGTTGSKQYTANWLSKRNQAWTKQKLDDPIIIEDTDSNVILFTYEIGEIRNVPVYEIEDFGYVNANGVSKTVTKTFSTTVSESLMESYTNTVSNSTVNSFGWTLSNSWSDSTSIDEEWCETQGMTKEEAESYSKSDTDGWYVSSGSSGSTTTQTLNTVDTYDLKTNTANASIGGGSSSSNTHAASLSNSLTVEAGLEMETKASVNANIGLGDDLGVGGSVEQSVKGSVGVSDTFAVSSSDSETNTKNRNYSVSGGESEQGGSISHTGTNTTSNSSWNSESGYNGSSTVTSSSTLSQAISESISNKYGYGKTYVSNSGESSTQGVTSTEASSDSYGSSVTYSTVTSEEQTVSYTTSNTISGYHRWIMVDTAHVFAVVGYDIASSSYFVTTYTVMEDNLKPYEDYSCSSGNYDDNQNSFIGFEVPYDTITSYVGNRVGQSEGLEVNSAGVITGYTGTDEYVVIPEYKVIKNQDGTNTVIKVTGISESAFKGNTNITGILLSSFVDEIPAQAFKGCSSLVEIQGCISTIGDEAFSGCVSMKAVNLGYGVTFIGENAFDSVEDIAIYAINKSVINAVVNSGAKNITVHITSGCESLDNTTITVPETTQAFTFNGYGKDFTDLYIVSDAASTTINRTTLVSTGKTPLQISSSEIFLQEVTVNAPGIGLICSAESTNIHLYGESYVTSANENAMLCKNIILGKIKDDYFSQLHVLGNVLICGEVENESYLSVENGEIICIDEETFDKYKQGTISVTFNYNEGSVTESTKTVYYGQLYGTLPVPTREHYSFVGWFTEAEGGDEITADSIVEALVNQTLYAHWSRNTYKVNFNANGGSVSTTSKNVESGAKYGTLPTPTRTGWTFKGWYTATSGGTQITADTTVALSGEQTLYARWQVNSYTASWSTGTGYSITVKRTSSPNAGASTGTISSGTAVYYGDVLSVTYAASTGYSLSSQGSTSISVTGNVTSSSIYATASANNYTYSIVYKSSNGTSLGSSSATHAFNSGTYTISAPAKSGYTTPASQSVSWNSTSKTITFVYTPTSVSTSQSVASGTWWTSSSGYTKLTYAVKVEYQNRTSSSVQIRMVWTNTLTATSGYYGYAQYCNATIGGVGTGDYTIAKASVFASSGGTRSSTVTTSWVTVPVSATSTSVSMSASWWDQNSKSGSWSATFSIPTY